jgi:hypothetical protein
MYPTKLLPFFAPLAVLFAGIGVAQSQPRQFQFEQFPVRVFKGLIRIPKGVRKVPDNEWIDEAGKSVGKPKVNFAGDYWLLGHSCGTWCRWYSLTSLRTGTDIAGIQMFNTAEPTPVTTDGHPYLTILYTRPDSRLIIAGYHLNFDSSVNKETCRQRYYLLEADKLRPISKTLPFCTEEPER